MMSAAEAGVPVSREAFYTVYNLPRPNDDGDAFTAERVAPYKKVRQVAFVDEIPKSASGKILRRVLVERDRSA